MMATRDAHFAVMIGGEIDRWKAVLDEATKTVRLIEDRQARGHVSKTGSKKLRYAREVLANAPKHIATLEGDLAAVEERAVKKVP